jgi:lipoprotein-anchoring transpeptidase ErfK/SrfK
MTSKTILKFFLVAWLGLAGALISSSANARQIVSFEGHQPGSVVVRTSERRLYFVLGDGRAVRYTVGVGKAGMQWSGRSAITGKYLKPDWEPPEDIRRANPRLPAVVPAESPGNPLGAAALTLHADYAIHGTNSPASIGRYVSHGCIRMHNRDVLDLFRRVSVGTPVIVTR